MDLKSMASVQRIASSVAIKMKCHCSSTSSQTMPIKSSILAYGSWTMNDEEPVMKPGEYIVLSTIRTYNNGDTDWRYRYI